MNLLIVGTANSGSMMIVWLIAIFGMLYFMMIRPQKKQMDQRKQMLASLKPGTHIISIGGITGVIRAVTEEFVYVEIAEGLVVEMTKQGVATIQDDPFAEEPIEDEEEAPLALEETQPMSDPEAPLHDRNEDGTLKP